MVIETAKLAQTAMKDIGTISVIDEAMRIKIEKISLGRRNYYLFCIYKYCLALDYFMLSK